MKDDGKWDSRSFPFLSSLCNLNPPIKSSLGFPDIPHSIPIFSLSLRNSKRFVGSLDVILLPDFGGALVLF